MTIAEYELRMEAYNLQRVEQQYDAATLAWMSRNAQAFDKDGNAVFKDFNEFFDRQNAIDQVRSSFEPNYQPETKNKKKRASKQDIMLKRIKEYQKLHPRKGAN